MPDILIATPTADRKVYTDFMKSVIKLVRLSAQRLDLTFRGPSFSDGALVSHARNGFATLVLEQPAISHLLFIDSDIGFEPEAVLQMLAFDKPFTACFCPKRQFDYGLLHAAARKHEDPEMARLSSLGFVGTQEIITREQDGARVIDMDRGFVRVGRIGMGLTLIRRDVFEIMRDRLPDLIAPPHGIYPAMGLKGDVFQCFEATTDAAGFYISEDFSFSQRWTQDCGGEIWVSTQQRISHTGPTEFIGRYEDRLKLGLGI